MKPLNCKQNSILGIENNEIWQPTENTQTWPKEYVTLQNNKA